MNVRIYLHRSAYCCSASIVEQTRIFSATTHATMQQIVTSKFANTKMEEKEEKREELYVALVRRKESSFRTALPDT